MDRLSYTKQENASSMLSSSDALLLAEYSKQLQLKTGIFTQLDEKIIEKLDDEKKTGNRSVRVGGLTSNAIPENSIHCPHIGNGLSVGRERDPVNNN